MLMNDHDIPGFWLQVSGGPVTHHVRHLSPTEILWFPGDSTPTGALRWSITCRISQAWWGEGRTSQGSDDTTKLQCQSFSIFVWFTKNWRFQMPNSCETWISDPPRWMGCGLDLCQLCQLCQLCSSAFRTEVLSLGLPWFPWPLPWWWRFWTFQIPNPNPSVEGYNR